MFNKSILEERKLDPNDELLGLKEEDFKNLLDKVRTEGIINNVRYEISTGEFIVEGERLRVEFINKE